ncbi:LLM class flavin-dependent oxidoreductase [Pseudonocardia kujensis]|uniref:LLM class flavin-dependent oxidoreductase n=1 Tax=Pseudonocardia kujensis TaxID=1128675 RepID=UPI001E33675A|nr:LLM class flavin-dependent oxidoreductase [Pseudonocardia kujensis]MCE0763557.1 LLM class flavin-dependent oxidoreductase [Pseudonocardia kujensis]
MKTGVILLPGTDLLHFAERVRTADRLGVDMVGVGDVPGEHGELVVGLTIAAGAAERAAIGPMVVNTVTRHPGVIAAAIRSISLLAPGGAFLGVGRGGSPVRGLGLEPPTTARLAAAVATIRHTLREDGGPRVPVMLSAYGPRTARAAGQCADGILVAAGADPELVGGLVAQARAGAVEAGRQEPPDVWLMTRVAIGEDRTEAVRTIRANLASAGANNLRSPAQLGSLPPDVQERLAELRARYQAAEHVEWDGANARLVDELDLTDFLADRFAIVGSEQEVAEHMRAVSEAGVTGVIAPSPDQGVDEFLGRFAAAAGSLGRSHG